MHDEPMLWKNLSQSAAFASCRVFTDRWKFMRMNCQIRNVGDYGMALLDKYTPVIY